MVTKLRSHQASKAAAPGLFYHLSGFSASTKRRDRHGRWRFQGSDQAGHGDSDHPTVFDARFHPASYFVSSSEL
jgi:hypothetical protein